MKRTKKRPEKTGKGTQNNKRKAVGIFILSGIAALLLPIVCEGVYQQSKSTYQALAAGELEGADGMAALPSEERALRQRCTETYTAAEETETESETETETETEPEQRSEVENGAEPEQSTEMKNRAEAGTGMENGEEAESGSGAENATEAEAGTERKNETEPEQGSEIENVTEAEAGTERKNETEPEQGSEIENVTEAEAGTERKNETEPEQGSETENGAEAESGTGMENGEEAEAGSAVESESETEAGTAMESEPETETEAIPVQPEKLSQTSVGTEEGCEEGALPEKETLKTPDTELVDEPEKDGIFVPDEPDRLLDALPEDDFLSTPELLERPEGGMQLPEGSDLSGIPDAGGNQMPDGTTETESEKEGNGDTVSDRESGQAEEMETQGGLEENEAMEENGATEELSETAGDRGAGENNEPEEAGGALPETGTKIEEETEHPKESEKKKEGKIVRGKHYDIVGDEGAYYRDEADRLWIREGSSLHIKTRAKSGFDKASGLENLSQDGIFSFCLQKTDENGAVLEKSELKQETYFVDGEAPPADIAVSGEVTEGISYAANAARVSVIVAPDGKSGLGSVAYRVIRCEKDGRLTEDPKQGEWTSCSSDQEIEIAEEGLFQIFVRTKDNVGNINFSKSTVVCVDRTPPELRIGGVEDQTANSGPVKIRVEGKDAYYKPGSLQVELIGKNTGKSPAVNRKKERKDGAVKEFFDFPDQKSYDDVYRLSVKAEDLAGNKAQKEYEFSVNRYGSVYDLAQETQRDLKKYFLSKAVPVVFYETNIDYIGESQIHCRRDGELRSLVKGRDYSVTMQGSRDSWKRYCYTIPAEYFDEEGIYELLLASGDRAKNRSDTGIQKKQVSFVLDRTAPDCVIAGIEENGTYQGKSVTVYLTPNDNMGICRMKVYRNSKLLLSKGEFAKEERTIRICLEAEDAWQTLQVFLEDRAGNAYWSREIPVYISERTGKTPEYRKVRASAQESEQEDKERKKVRSAKAGLSVRRIQKEMKQAVLNQGGRLVSGSLSPAVGSGEKRMPEGNAILLFGVLVFCLTSLSYVISIRRKTGGRK